MSSGVHALPIRKAAVLMDVDGVITFCEAIDRALHLSDTSFELSEV